VTARAVVAVAVALVLASCDYAAPFIVLTIDAPPDAAGVVQLAITVTSGTASASLEAPPRAAAPLTWPQSMSVQLPAGSRGDFHVDVVARDALSNELARAAGDVHVDGNGQFALALTLAPDARIAAPRPLAPLSTATVTSQQPRLRWALAAGTDGAWVELCYDAACAAPMAGFAAPGDSAPAIAILRAGTVFWRLRGMAGGVVGAATGPMWQFTVGTATASTIDGAWGTTLDVNGDGFADVAVGAPDAVGGAGRVYVYLGSPSGLAAHAPIVLTGPDGAGGRFGAAVASAGDVNGDGFTELVVGASGASNAYVFAGGPGTPAASPAVTLHGPDGGAFGTATAAAGDVNGDGFADLIVGAPGAAAAGRAYLYLGGPSGVAPSPIVLDAPAGATATFGQSLAGPGDVDGDGFADVVVTEDFATPPRGPAFWFRGAAAGLGAALPIAGTSGGVVAGAGDVDGDGYADVLVVGESGGVRGAQVVRGGASGPVPGWTLDGGTLGGAAAGDLDGDGLTDVLVGDVDRAYVFLGGAAPGVVEPALTLPAMALPGSGFGAAVARAGDVDGDARVDLVIGAPAADVAWLYFGTHADLTFVAPPAPLSGPDSGRFGAAVY
jgi:FG-GAP repeat/FG-GAP-like repeat